MSGWEKTIKTPKMVRNIANCSKHICMGSRSMFAADNLILHYKLSCKARLKNDKDLG